jgi:hypothetical protein
MEPTENLRCNLNFKKLALLALRERTLNKKQLPKQAKRLPRKTLIQTPFNVDVLSTINTRLFKTNKKSLKKQKKKKKKNQKK